MIMNPISFDSIIYSANIAGVIAASIFKSKNKHVLILNRYGFFGGTITESLNLFQKKISNNLNDSEIIHKILRRIFEYKNSVLYEDETHLIFNPEVVKYALQKFSEQNQINLLFHISPYSIEFKDEWINLSVIGREGIINLSCKELYDFSTEFTFAPIIDKSIRTLSSTFVNFITLPVKDESVFGNVFISKKLKDNRWWISVKNRIQNVFEVEISAQNIFDKYDEMLRKQKSRIQIVPAQSNLIFQFTKSKNISQRISFITDFIDLFNSEDELLIAKQIERSLTDVRNF